MDLEHFDFTDNSSESPINVLVCDNESLFREILIAALSNEPSINVVGAAASGIEAIELVKDTTPGVVLMDIELGDGPNGIVIAADIKQAFPDIGIVVLSSHRDKESSPGSSTKALSDGRFCSSRVWPIFIPWYVPSNRQPRAG